MRVVEVLTFISSGFVEVWCTCCGLNLPEPPSSFKRLNHRSVPDKLSEKSHCNGGKMFLLTSFCLSRHPSTPSRWVSLPGFSGELTGERAPHTTADLWPQLKPSRWFLCRRLVWRSGMFVRADKKARHADSLMTSLTCPAETGTWMQRRGPEGSREGK